MKTKWLFVDMNSYFASVEQQLQPRLRGRPVAVVAVEAETTCCLAASYEAKAYGVKTGTLVNEARFLCPEITFLPARTEEYVRFHKEILKAVESVLPVHRVHSIDEMSCRLLGQQCEMEQAVQLGRGVKQAIKQQVGEMIRCSVGLAPNRLLAKVASDMQKPDGLTVLPVAELPQCLYSLKLNDFPGIGPRMLTRFHRAGVRTVEQMCQLSAAQLHRIWGGIVGDRWWHLLRGEDLAEKPTQRRTVSHSHVLPPEFRNAELAYQVLMKLTHKAACRLRELNYWAGGVSIGVSYLREENWSASARLGDVQDTQTILEAVSTLWEQRPEQQIPFKLDVTLNHLKSFRSCALPLFPEQQRRQRLAKVMDSVNEKLGEGAVYLAALHTARQAAPDRIAFQSIPEPRFLHPSAQ